MLHLAKLAYNCSGNF